MQLIAYEPQEINIMAKRIGRKYHSKRLGENYDTIVIGSGIGGLCTAAILAKSGQKVCVLEQHYTAGGFTHTYVRNGYEWDVGVHYVGDVQKPWSPIRRVFDFISDGQLKWEFMDEVYDKIVIGENEYDYVAGRHNFSEKMKEYFPGEEAAIDEYIKRISQVNSLIPRFFAGQNMPRQMGMLFNKFRKHLVPDYFNQAVIEVLRELTDNDELIGVLAGQWGDYGHPPGEASFLIHALIAKHFLAGGNYPVGGSSKIAETILPVIKSTGGEVFTYAEVDKIIIEKNTAKGVRLANGDEIMAKNIVSAAGITNTVTRFLPEEVAKQHGFIRKIEKTPASSSHLCLYIGLKETASELKLPKTNYWIYNSNDHDGEVARFKADQSGDLPLTYISFPSAKDPEHDANYPGRSTIEVLTMCEYDWFKQWKGTPWGKRGTDYEAYKEELSQKLLKVLFKHFPHLKGKIDYYELSTPLSTEKFQLNDKGEIYGVVHTPERFEQNWLHPKSPIKGLYLTGQDVLTAGIGGALLAGVMTAGSMMGLKGLSMIKDIFMGKNQKTEKPIISTKKSA